MKTTVITKSNSDELVRELNNKWYSNPDVSIVYSSLFFDEIEGKYKSIICYYE